MTTRRQRGEGSVYQRHDHPSCPAEIPGPPEAHGRPTMIRPDHRCRGTWVGALHLGYREGKRRRKVVSGRTQAEAVRRLAELKKHATPDMPTAAMRLDRWLDHWVNHIAATTGKPSKRDFQKDKIRNYIAPAIGRHRLDRLTTDHVRELHTYVMVTKALSSTTAGHAHAVLSVALNDAMRESPPLVQRNVAALVKKPRPRESSRRGLSMPEALAVLRQAGTDERLGSRWLVALMLGVRQGERLGLRWQYLDLGAGVADWAWQLRSIPYRHGCGGPGRDGSWPCGRRRADSCPDRELDVQPDFTYLRLDGNLCLIRLKSDGSTRVTPLPPPVVAALRARHQRYLAERDGYTVDHDLVWCREDGRPLRAGDDWAAWSALLRACGMPHLTQHEARHTTATLLQSMGVDEATRMAIMGHSVAATQRGYAHVDLTLQRRALDALGERLSLRP